MTRRVARTALAVAAAAAIGAACVTINVYFPAAAIKDLSRQIEDQVRKEAAEQAREGDSRSEGEGEAGREGDGTANRVPPGAPGASRGGSASAPAAQLSRDGAPAGLALLELLAGATPAIAQSADVPAPEISSPAIRRIIESRAARVAALDGYKAKGAIGENNQALLEPRNLEALADLKARAEVQRLVKAENADREELFREIAAAKKVDASQIPKIRETYAATLREKARSGDWIQMPDGAWKQK